MAWQEQESPPSPEQLHRPSKRTDNWEQVFSSKKAKRTVEMQEDLYTITMHLMAHDQELASGVLGVNRKGPDISAKTLREQFK